MRNGNIWKYEKMSEGGIHETQWQNFILILSEWSIQN